MRLVGSGAIVFSESLLDEFVGAAMGGFVFGGRPTDFLVRVPLGFSITIGGYISALRASTLSAMVPPSLDMSAGGGGKGAFLDPTFLPFCTGNFSTRLEVADRPNIFARPALEFGSITVGAFSGFRERENLHLYLVSRVYVRIHMHIL